MSYSACACDYDPPEFHGQRVRTARKQSTCYECRCPIMPGEKYEHTFGKWDGDVSSFKTCAACLELRNWAQISVPCFCWTYGEVYAAVRSLVEEARKDMPAGWIFEWGRRAVKVRQRVMQHRDEKAWRGMQEPAWY